ncbi:MAG TPA: diguanylate cyclase [Propionicimonas sp.]|nr:diguanylate cyclase [Propionicimonas sp.]
MIPDPVVIANAAGAVICAVIATVTWRRRAQNPNFATALTFVMLGGCWWSVSLAVVVGSTNQTVAALATLLTFPGPTVLIAAFLCLGLSIARPQWVPRPWMLAALLVEPVLITLAGLTNPWHLLVYGGAGAAQLTGSAGWTYGPVFWVDSVYGIVVVVLGMALVAWSWWTAPPAFRAQRLAVFLAALVPLAVNVVFLYGGFGDGPDPTPLGFAVTGTIMWWAIFRQELFTFSPVARALIVDQIGDAVLVVSAEGRILDVNAAGDNLLRAMNPGAPTKLVGLSARELVGDVITLTYGRQSELVVEFPGGRTEFEVRSSPLVDRRRRALGNVYVARDVTEANTVSRRLAAAHTQLVRQVETIDLLRADLVEQASRDPLTGLHNRRHMLDHFAPMLAATAATGGTLAVALFDVDKFKSVNDNHGHLAGDAVLIAVARRLEERAPAGALVARWGGEEFFVALPGANATTWLMIADDLRRRCAQDTIEVAGRTIGCTLIGGVAAYPSSGTTMDELFHAADLAMYEAKNAGRNVVRGALDQALFTVAGPAEGRSLARKTQAANGAVPESLTSVPRHLRTL